MAPPVSDRTARGRRSLLRSKARGRALSRLQRRHPDEYLRYYRQERRKAGLD